MSNLVSPPRVVFVSDVKGWSIDNYMHRLSDHFTEIDLVRFYVFEDGADHKSVDVGSRLLSMPAADVYYFGSWWWFWEYLKSGGQPLKKVMIDVVDDYSWASAPVAWQSVCSAADVILTQSLPLLHKHSDAVFHPFPIDSMYTLEPLKPFIDCRTKEMTVGMIAGSFAHSGADHKGVGLVKRVVDRIEGARLLVAGVDVMYGFDDLHEFYRGIDCFVCGSRSEGFSSSVVNAAAFGTPIISTPVSPLEPFISGVGYWQLPDRAHGDKMVEDRLFDILTAFKTKRHRTFNKVQYARNVSKMWAADKVAMLIKRLVYGLQYGD